MISPQRIVVFSLDVQRFGLDLAVTERVLPAVEITPLPHAPDIVLGIINLQGRIIPVMNVRRRFGLPERPVAPEDHFIVTQMGGRTLALVADGVAGVTHLRADELVAPESVLGSLPHVAGIVRRPDGLVLIHDLRTFLALDEAVALGDALDRLQAGAAAR